MELVISFIVSVFSTTIGAITGLGGGLIIKPLLTTITEFSLEQISFLSAVTVFFMAALVTIKNVKKGSNPFSEGTVFLAIGSIMGGLVGTNIFYLLVLNLNNNDVVESIQAFLIILMLIFVLVVNAVNLNLSFKKNIFNLVVFGIFMGLIASFLGIGGGPINMVILMICFSYDIKQAAVKSAVTILFAQMMSLLLMYINTGFEGINIYSALAMIIGACIGANAGINILRNLSVNKARMLFNTAVICIIILNSYIIF